ncbi:unnamed protein product [Calypogeia fissa]
MGVDVFYFEWPWPKVVAFLWAPLAAPFLLVWFFYLRNNKQTKYRLLPGPPTYPIIGNMNVFLDTSKPTHHVVDNLAKTYGPLLLLKDLIVAGSDTSTSTLEWSMSELLKAPELMKRAQEEVDKVAGFDRTVNESDIPNMPFLAAVRHFVSTRHFHGFCPIQIVWTRRWADMTFQRGAS